MIKKCLGLLSSLLLIGILSGSVLYFGVTPTPAVASTKVAKSKAKGKVIVYYVYGKRGHTGKYLWSKKTLTGKIGTTYHTKALDLLNDSGYMALASHSKNTSGKFTRKTTKVYYRYYDVIERDYEFKHEADLYMELTGDHHIGLFDRNLQDGVEAVVERTNFSKPYYDVSYSNRVDTGHGSGLKEFHYRFGSTHRFKDNRDGNIYTMALTNSGGITFHAVATKHSTMNELVQVSAHGKLLTAKIRK
ncbi:MucBP domain-containing protein [Levilactobacillus brevis]|uniref:MucBP domain-containing protein n=1 Tax=Levilactobacillus brevis TaxID=1580 RepID=UPI002072AE24|nr:MucBP domain-containing protein [Levilactobacillus brevis]